MEHRIVSREEWLAARKAHLANEKELTRRRDALSAERRALPWVRIEKDYTFEGWDGELSLADLFAGKSQLIVYHFMFAPGASEGCPSCSFLADHFDGANRHLKHHDVSLVAVSRAPYVAFQPFRRRMGWDFAWVSSAGSDFNYDFHVSPSPAEKAAGRYEYNYEMHDGEGGEMPGFSVFYRDEAGGIFHTYSTYARVAHDAAVQVLAGELSALEVEAVSVAVAGRHAEDADIPVILDPAHLAVAGNIAPDEIAALRVPGRPFQPETAGPEPLDRRIGLGEVVEGRVHGDDVRIPEIGGWRAAAAEVARWRRDRRGRAGAIGRSLRESRRRCCGEGRGACGLDQPAARELGGRWDSVVMRRMMAL
ncbi:hypothetical protein BTHI11S_01959 [Bosea thiooxidans]